MLPEGWSQKSLEQISIGKLTNGVFNDPKLVGNGYRLINVVDLYNPLYIDVSNLKRLAIPKKEFEKYKALKGDLFFTRSSLKLDGIAHCARLTDDFDDIIYDCHIMRLRCNHDEIDSNFLYEYCNSYPARKHFMRYAKTGTMTTIDQAGVSTLVVPLPPLPEQKKIAQILSTWDNAISATERLLDNSQQRKKALMQQLLTGKKRLPGFEGEWEERVVGDDFDVRSSKRVLQEDWKTEGIPFFRTRELVSLSKNEPFRSEIFISEKLYEEISKKYGTPKEGDFLVSGVGTLGISYQVKARDVFYFKDGNVLWFKTKNMINSDFFNYCFHSVYFQNQINAQAAITTVGTFTIQNAKKIKFFCPPTLDEQRKIATILTTADQEIDALQKRLDHLKLEKKALMQQLLTGKRRVLVDTEA